MADCEPQCIYCGKESHLSTCGKQAVSHCIASCRVALSQYITGSEWNWIEICNGSLSSIASLADSEWKCLCLNYSPSMTNRKWVILYFSLFNIVLIHAKQTRVRDFANHCIIPNLVILTIGSLYWCFCTNETDQCISLSHSECIVKH